jgi:translation initiation factor 4E
MNNPNNNNIVIHKLNSRWVLWYHDPENSDWDFKSYEKICVFDTIELFWSIHNYIKNELLYSGMFFIMKENINPLWEDNNNINGGCWSFKILKKNSYNAWINLSVYLIGETLTEEYNFINGISISPKKGFCIIKIWINNTSKSNIKNIRRDIPFFDNDEYIYKSFS